MARVELWLRVDGGGMVGRAESHTWQWIRL